jgi:hypothetical protein
MSSFYFSCIGKFQSVGLPRELIEFLLPKSQLNQTDAAARVQDVFKQQMQTQREWIQKNLLDLERAEQAFNGLFELAAFRERSSRPPPPSTWPPRSDRLPQYRYYGIPRSPALPSPATRPTDLSSLPNQQLELTEEDPEEEARLREIERELELL